MPARAEPHLDAPRDETELEARLAKPSKALVAMMRRLDGDILVAGIGGKMGESLAGLAVAAIREAGVKKRVIGAARFSKKGLRRDLERIGVETVPCDLLDPEAVAKLPKARNVVFMAGRKFGTGGQESLTWATNALAPAYVAQRFRRSKIAAFSTGCVYALAPAQGRGSSEKDPMAPVGEYAQSCVARERVFEFASRAWGTPVALIRLNYANDLRYGVLHDIGRWVLEGKPVPLRVPAFNAIWQGDANDAALRAFERCGSPPAVLNVTGPERLSVRETALAFGRIFGKKVRFAGKEGPRAYLSDASKAIAAFGKPSVSARTLIEWTADWLSCGNPSLGLPTHFEVSDGKY